MALDEDHRRRAARVIWVWSGRKQPDLSEEALGNRGRLKASLEPGRNSPPSTDELFALAAVAGVPEQFVVDGFLPPLHQRVADLERASGELSGAVDEALGVLARHEAEIEELRGEGPSEERGEGSGR